MISIQDVQIVADGLDHPECVAIHPDGSVWAGGEAGQIYRISRDGSNIEEVCNTGGFVLGIAFSPDASWLAICDLKKRCIWKLLLETRTLILLAESVEGSSISIPNFPVFDPNGVLYISESGGFRTITGRIYRFDTDGNSSVWHRGPFNFANGMALSPDQQYLYVACTWLPGVERIQIQKDGSAGEREVALTLPNTCPDGIAFDADGNLYIACYTPNAIYKVDKEGDVSTLIHDWEAHTVCNPTNIAFGGKHFDELFIAGLGRWHIGKIKMNTKGLPLPCHTNSKYEV